MNAKPNPALKRSVDKADPKTVESLAAKASISETLAAFVRRTRYDDIPADVRTRALHHMLDAAGIAVAATRYDHTHRVLTAMRGLGGAGNVPVLGFPARLSMREDRKSVV